MLSLLCCGSKAGPPATPSASAIASSDPRATRAGMAIIKQGGNAFDAAVAVTAVLAVIEPYSAGLGGGGLWLIRRAGDGKQVLIDGRERAPELANRQYYLDRQGRPQARASIDGALAAAIPGTPAAIVHLARNYGRLPLSVSLGPAIAYAENGFIVRDKYRLRAGMRKKDLRLDPASAMIFLDHGKVPGTGYRLKQKDLAQVFKAMAKRGRAGFYRGEVADRLVNGVNKYGGDWTRDDLASYKVVERPPIVFTYRDMQVVAAPPPSAGGIVLGQAMKILEHFNIRAMGKVSRMHYIIEAMRRGYRDYADYLGDPDYVDVPVQRLLNPAYLDGLAMTVDPLKATPSQDMGDTPGPSRAGLQTTHFSILDAEGNRVAGTLSVSSVFGSAFVPKGTGVLLNNAMHDFSLGTKNGPTAGGANALQPGKRPLTSMSPTFLETPDRLLILGTPGGNRICSMILLAALDFDAGQSLTALLKAPRYHHQYLPDVVEFEWNGLSFATQRKLHDMGYHLRELPGRYGDMQAVMWDKRSNRVSAASDPRGSGAAMVWAR